jgi:hypothetical protein
MKKLILIAALIGLAGSVMAQNVTVVREALGSGQPESKGVENASKWDNNVFHAPQYMPGYPTAATLYPRIIDVPCTATGNTLSCKGYNWLPELGRGEYLMIRPTVVVAEKPQVITKIVTVPGPVQIREVLVEVPKKPKKE